MKHITFNEQSVTSTHGLVILDVLDLHNLGAESQCRNGFCGACRCKLVSGHVKYVSEPIAYFEEGEILPCISVAETDIVISKQAYPWLDLNLASHVITTNVWCQLSYI